MLTYPLKSEADKYETLTRIETNKLIILSQKGDLLSHEKVFKHNLRLLFKIVSNFKPNWKMSGYETPEDIEDLIIELSIILWKCIDKFDISKNYAFSTYAYRALTNKSISFYARNNKYRDRTISLETIIEIEDIV